MHLNKSSPSRLAFSKASSVIFDVALCDSAPSSSTFELSSKLDELLKSSLSLPPSSDSIVELLSSSCSSPSASGLGTCALGFSASFSLASFSFLQQSYKENTLGDQLAGPIGIVKNADQMMLDQVRGVLFLFIIISLFVGLFNLLPIPLLDGGHIMYFIIRRIFSNSLPEFITRVYLAVGITIISFLFIVVTYNDIFYK